MVGHAKGRAGSGELADPVLPQAAIAVGGEVRVLGRDDLAELAQGAGDQRDRSTLRRVLGYRRAGADRLVIRMGVHEQEPVAVIGCAHTGEPNGGRPGRGGR